jgi:hypothetical protein
MSLPIALPRLWSMEYAGRSPWREDQTLKVYGKPPLALRDVRTTCGDMGMLR